MHKEFIWVACDGTRFDGNNAYFECKQHEDKLKDVRYSSLTSFIQFFNGLGKPMMYSAVERGETPEYIKVLNVPDEDDDIFDLWREVVPSDLDDEICCYGEGWYVCSDGATFEYWEHIVNKFLAMQNVIEEINKGN